MSYITTYTKIHFDPLNPNPQDISIQDIAHALSLMTRANGHFPAFHSVAQHCIECCEEALARGLGSRVALACLLHDASEAYLADITRPVKQYLPQYHTFEDRLLQVIYSKYLGGISEEEHRLVKEMDDTLLYYEFYHFMGEELSKKPEITRIPDFAEIPFRDAENRYLELFSKLYEPDMTIFNSAGIPLNTIQIHGVLFDMDGLILDTEKLYTRFWQEAANILGYPMTKEQALGMRSLNRDAGLARLRSYFGNDFCAEDYRNVRNKRIELMNAFIEQEGVILKPGIQELLAYLKAHHIKTAIATSSPMERTIKYLSSVNMEHAFDAIISGYMVEHGKPEPDIYLFAAKELGLKPENCLALEDSPSGLLSAKRAGCLPVMIPDQDQPDDAVKQLLFAKAERLDYVIPLLEKIR